MNYLQTESAPTLGVLRGVLGQNYTRLSVAESVRCDKVLAKICLYLSQAVYVNQIVIPAPLCGRRWGLGIDMSYILYLCHWLFQPLHAIIIP